MNTHNLFYGEVQTLMPLYANLSQMPFLSGSCMHKFL